MSTLRIAIIGAGPSGLTLARLLRQQTPALQATIFELDTSLKSRDQGGTIDLHGSAGQLALKAADLHSEFLKHARYEGEAMKAMKWDGTVLLEHKDGSQRAAEMADRPEIDRGVLREMLVNSLGSDGVRWGMKLQDVKASKGEADAEQYDLHFADGTVERGFDLVIGAEGAWSKVRKMLTDVQPFYAGASMLECWAMDVKNRKPWLADFVGEGSLFMFDEGRLITAQRSATDLRTYVGVRIENEMWLEECGIDWDKPEEAKREVVEKYFGDCHEDLKKCIMESDDKLIPRKMWQMPVGARWSSRPGITLMGDAAHLMSPAMGIGVNLAMMDALDLANSLAKIQGDKSRLSEAIEEYEQTMFERSAMWGKKSEEGLKGHLSRDGLEQRVKMMQKKMSGGQHGKA